MRETESIVGQASGPGPRRRDASAAHRFAQVPRLSLVGICLPDDEYSARRREQGTRTRYGEPEAVQLRLFPDGAEPQVRGLPGNHQRAPPFGYSA